jgi:hypothetical protein
MRRASGRRILLGLSCLPVLFAAWGSAASASHVGTDALIGQRVGGTPASWSSIKQATYPRHFDPGLAAVPTYTGQTGNGGSVEGIVFFEFPSSKAASTFLLHPPNGLISVVGETAEPLVGRRPTKAPSRWLDLEDCIYEGSGPNPNHAPMSAPADSPDANGKCAVGSPKSGGVASMTQRGDVVFVVDPDGFRIVGGRTPISSTAALSKKAINYNVTLTENTLALLDQTGIT